MHLRLLVLIQRKDEKWIKRGLERVEERDKVSRGITHRVNVECGKHRRWESESGPGPGELGPVCCWRGRCRYTPWPPQKHVDVAATVQVPVLMLMS